MKTNKALVGTVQNYFRNRESGGQQSRAVLALVYLNKFNWWTWAILWGLFLLPVMLVFQVFLNRDPDLSFQVNHFLYINGIEWVGPVLFIIHLLSLLVLPALSFYYRDKMQNLREDWRIDQMCNAFDRFKQVFGKQPHKLGYEGTGRAMVKTAKRILRSQANNQSDEYLQHKLQVQFDVAACFLLAPESYGPIFAAAKAGRRTLY